MDMYNEYIAKVKTGAPASVVNNATITMPQPDAELTSG
ncbi:hypothetical protein V1293_004079 [Bradyrhizobium sp. AZCC 1693]